MTLAPGTRLGSHEIVAPLGAGGMGEVYRAHDTRLGRDVAIKVLPAAFAADKDRMARFEREAHVLASLSHPHIAVLYGFEEREGLSGLVMELVEGPTLAQRLEPGAMTLEEALPLACEIAEALEYAHEHGIIHRDLKPANVKLTGDGAVKLLDFGLAKALEDAPAPQDPSHSPTLSVVATRAGVILGTAGYMSPEQAKGKPADRRADVWAFGVVLYEMLSGKPLFRGETASETLALVITQEPDWTSLPQTTPPRVRELIRRSLIKEPRKRLQAIGEARLVIEEHLTGASGTSLVVAAAPPVSGQAALWHRSHPWVTSALGLATLSLLLDRAVMRPAPGPASPLRLSAELGADASVVAGGSGVVLSPDGSMLAVLAQKGTAPGQIYVRRLDQLQATPLPGTEGAWNPFFSPDGHGIAFFAGGKLKKVAATGGAVITLCDARGATGTWWEDGTIAFAHDAGGVGLQRVPAAGGTPEPLTKLEPGEVTHRSPQALPDDKAVLFTSHTVAEGFDDASIVVQPLPSGPRRIVQRGGFHGRYLRSGHVVYIHEGTLFAVPFDKDRLEVTGPPAPVVEGVSNTTSGGGARFGFSTSGTFVYLPGESAAGRRALSIQWLDREGRTSPLRAVPADYNNLHFSPDGNRLAMDINDGKQDDIWVYEWARDTLSRLPFDAANDTYPTWTPDGRSIAFASTRADKTAANLYWQRADGTGEMERLTESKNNQYPSSWHPSGKFLAFQEINPQTQGDIMILEMEGDLASGWKPGKPKVFLGSPFNDVGPVFSPDGRWLAYFSTESGRFEVYVRPFPGPGGKWQISNAGGYRPMWSPKRQELFYRTQDNKIMVSAYSVSGDAFRADKPQLWSPGQFTNPRIGQSFHLHPDGQRFAVLKAVEEQADVKRDKLVFIFNFFDELRRIAPAGKR